MDARIGPRAYGRLSFSRRGFTLVEMLVVMAIIIILASLGFFIFRAGYQAADQIVADVDAVVAKLEHHAPPPAKSKGTIPIPDQHIYLLQDHVSDVAAEVKRLSASASLTVLHVYQHGNFKGFAARTTPENHAILKADAAIQGVEQDHKFFISAQQIPRGVQRVFVNQNYNGTPAGVPAPSSKADLQKSHQPIWSNVNVAVIDTGIDSSHPDLNMVMSRGFVDGNARDVADKHGHGTHVAGTIGAFNNALGVVGVAPGVRLINLKILDADGSGSYADLLAALNYVRTHASTIHVANMSLGGPYSASINKAVDQCVQAGVVMVVAAGNDAKPASKFSPSSASLAIAVGALADADGKAGGKGGSTSYGQDDTFANFSNYGSLVKVLAPGVKIASTYPVSMGSYAVMSGTSMASPHVAGLAARIQNASLDPTSPGARTFFPGRAAGTRATPAEILNVLKTHATEKIHGRFDSLNYPLINARGL